MLILIVYKIHLYKKLSEILAREIQTGVGKSILQGKKSLLFSKERIQSSGAVSAFLFFLL